MARAKRTTALPGGASAEAYAELSRLLVDNLIERLKQGSAPANLLAVAAQVLKAGGVAGPDIDSHAAAEEALKKALDGLQLEHEPHNPAYEEPFEEE